MTRKCCVPKCNSNYLTERRNDGKNGCISTFSFPKDPILKTKWIKNIPRDNWQPTEFSYVCIKHFDESEIERYQRFTNKDGNEIAIPLRYPKLKENVYPHIFANLPSYLSTSAPNERSDPDKRRVVANERHEKQVADFLQRDVIQNFEEFSLNFTEKLDTLLKKYWRSVVKPDAIFFYLLNTSVEETTTESLEVLVHVIVKSDLTVSAFKRNIPVEKNDLEWVLYQGNKLNRWSQIENMLNTFKNESFITKDSVEVYIETAVQYLEKLQTLKDDIIITLILGQLRLFNKQKKNYDSTTMVFAFMIFNNSRSTYKLLKTFLALPTIRHLQNIISSADISPSNEQTNNGYLKHIFANLNDREKIISLLLDEIYVTPNLTYKSNSIKGYAVNDPEKLARTVLTFMITSCFGSCKEVVKLVPIQNLSAKQIKEITEKVILEIQAIGFKIMAVISDNNRVNQNLFKQLANGLFFDNPSYQEEKIFVMFDPVHIFKNVRNNWLNLKSSEKSFSYPDFDDFSTIKTASFQHLREYHLNEEKSLIKNAYKLNRKTLHPNNLERQNVTLVDNVFHDTTISALKSSSKYKDTANFLQIIRNWWNILNVKNTTKGLHRRLHFSTPVTSTEDDKIEFLKKFLKWLNVWKNGTGGELTNDTHQAIVQTTSVIIELVKYSFNKFDVKYLLLGKFQTDHLERRFGQYRTLSGNSYCVSYTQIVEAEKRIRLGHLLKGEDFKKFLKTLSNDEDDKKTSEIKIDEFTDILFTDHILSSEVSSSFSFEYVCGVASHSVKERLMEEAKRKQPEMNTQKEPACDECISLVLKEKGSTVGNPYYDELQRGGLCIATDEVKSLMEQTCAITECLKNDSQLYSKFIKKENQGIILLKLVRLNAEHNGNGVMICSIHSDRVFKMITSTFKNIVLDNFCKIINNVASSDPKKRKVQTYSKGVAKNTSETECKKQKLQSNTSKLPAQSDGSKLPASYKAKKTRTRKPKNLENQKVE